MTVWTNRWIRHACRLPVKLSRTTTCCFNLLYSWKKQKQIISKFFLNLEFINIRNLQKLVRPCHWMNQPSAWGLFMIFCTTAYELPMEYLKPPEVRLRPCIKSLTAWLNPCANSFNVSMQPPNGFRLLGYGQQPIGGTSTTPNFLAPRLYNACPKQKWLKSLKDFFNKQKFMLI